MWNSVLIMLIALIILGGFKLRQILRPFLKEENDAVIHIPRLLAITIPLLFVTICHIASALGADVPAYLLSPAIDVGIIMTGAIIAVLGMSAGLLTPFLLIIVLWGVDIYVYFQYEINLI